MVLQAPPIDTRGPAEVAGQVRRLLVNYLHEGYGWREGDDGGEPGRALTGICAYFSALVIDRINRAPEKNFLAFLDLLGNSLTPAIPAEVPLTFFLDANAPGGRAIPAGTRVQADPADDGGEPVIFETEGDLWLSNFELKALEKWTGRAAQPRDLGPLLRSEKFDSDEYLFDRKETLYFGLHLAPGRVLEAGRTVSLYFFLDPLEYDSTAMAAAEASAPRVVWEYLSGTQAQPRWRPLPVEDGTENLTRSGPVAFLVPEDFSKLQRHLFELGLYWVRASLRAPSVASGAGTSARLSENQSTAVYGPAPRLHAVALNTVLARHATTLRDEILGSSNGNPGQSFKTFRRPILAGETLEVLEARASGTQAIAAPEEWTRWREVPDFHGSGPSDRHYVVDRQAGEIRFGDGQRGLIPPPGTRNVRMASYRTGGGLAGNIAAGAAKTPVAAGRYIEKVVNLVSAAGGAEGDAPESLLERAPKALRHRFRAVTDEDYEDLAKHSSTQVARALCVPLIDLAREPVKVIETVADEAAGAGKVSVIIVPRSGNPKPLPSLSLMRLVEDDLRGRASATAAIRVVGPLYLGVKVAVRLKLVSLSLQDRVDRDLRQALAAWLHPLTGRGGAGWAFGREPHESDIYRLIGDIGGVDHVIDLSVTAEADVPPAGWAQNLPAGERTQAVRDTRRFLVYSGRHDIEPF